MAVVDIIVIIGVIFALCSVFGMLRMPDTFCRMQASTIISTLVIILVCIAGIVYSAIYAEGNKAEMIIKLAVLALFYVITSPIAGYALARGAYRSGSAMTAKNGGDKYGEDLEK